MDARDTSLFVSGAMIVLCTAIEQQINLVVRGYCGEASYNIFHNFIY